MMEGVEEEGEAAATDTSARSLAGAACGDMAMGRHRNTGRNTLTLHFWFTFIPKRYLLILLCKPFSDNSYAIVSIWVLQQ